MYCVCDRSVLNFIIPFLNRYWIAQWNDSVLQKITFICLYKKNSENCGNSQSPMRAYNGMRCQSALDSFSPVAYKCPSAFQMHIYFPSYPEIFGGSSESGKSEKYAVDRFFSPGY